MYSLLKAISTTTSTAKSIRKRGRYQCQLIVYSWRYIFKFYSSRNLSTSGWITRSLIFIYVIRYLFCHISCMIIPLWIFVRSSKTLQKRDSISERLWSWRPRWKLRNHLNSVYLSLDPVSHLHLHLLNLTVHGSTNINCQHCTATLGWCQPFVIPRLPF